MRILVTGASGFVGSHLVEHLLAKGHEVSVLLRASSARGFLSGVLDRVTVVEGDLDPRQPSGEGLVKALEACGAVIHAGGTTRKVKRAPDELFRVNEGGTARLAELCAGLRTPPRLVIVGSISAVGPSLDGRPLDEETPCRPLSAYGQSKRAQELAAFAQRARLEVVVARLPGVYGTRDVNFVQLASTVRRGLRPVGARRVDFVHIRDACTALIACAERPGLGGETFHITSGPLTLEVLGRTLAKLIGRRTVPLALPGPLVRAVAAIAEGAGWLTGKAPSLDRDKARELVASWPVSIEKAAQRLGYLPQVTFEEGAREALAWCRAEGLVKS